MDRINLHHHYKINEFFFNKFEEVDLHFEGYFTKVEFEIVQMISKHIKLNITFYSNTYNQKSLEVFKDIINDLKIDYKYKIDLTNKIVLEEEKIEKNLKSLEIKGFSSRLNQIAYIKDAIVRCVQDGVDPSKIALVLPDETFAASIQLFDNEKYFNYAMGKTIKNSKLYQVSYAIYSYLSEDDIKYISNLEFLKLDRVYIDKNIRTIWNKNITKESFLFITSFIKSHEDNVELIEKYDELLYKLNIIIFSNENKILLKDVYKIFLQKLVKLSLDDVNSGKITVLGLLETRAVEFDTLIICDFNESFISGEGSIIGDEAFIANPKQLNWGTAPILVQSSTNPGTITIKASMFYKGTLKPIAGEITLNSVPTNDVLLYDKRELEAKKDNKLISSEKSSNSVNNKIEIELKKVKKELHDLKLKTVEKQQEEFGEKSKED